MNASVEWLSAFVESGLGPYALRDLITGRVATVDAVVPLRTDLGGIVVARVTAAERHADSDHLWITQVDAGGDAPLQVVCGAPNVTVGTRYPFAPVGVTMPGGMTIERRKIRGQLSNGMLCSARELGLGDDRDGILPLDTDAAPGTPLLEALPVGDTRLVIDVLPNRPDLLSHLGLAREIAAAVGRSVREPAIPGVVLPTVVPAPARTARTGVTAGVRVVVEEGAACSAYLGAVIRDVRVGPSPAWLVSRLTAVGVRSINNVVDITNYMLHGYGQPMHAFDRAHLAGDEVHVRRARQGERLATLDGVERALEPQMTVIADGKGAQAIAGVIGGKGSEVSESTTAVFLEVAAFDARAVRAVRRALELSTDASYRFERLVPPSSPVDTYATAVRLLEALTGGRLAGPPVVIGEVPTPPAPIELRERRVAQVLGVAVPAAECASLLGSIGFSTRDCAGGLAVTAPSWRTDVAAEIDLIEEVARLRGYDTIPDELGPYRLGTVPDDPLVALSDRLRELLVGHGFLEVRPMPFVADGGRAGQGEGEAVRVTNPLADNEAFLRRDIVSSLARRAEFNLAHMEGNLRLFEIGTTFQPASGGGPNSRPVERVSVGALCMGARRPPHFTEPAPPAWDEWDAKALGEAVASLAWPGMPVLLEPDGVGDVLWRVRSGTTEVGRVTRLRLDAPPWAGPAYGVEVGLATTDTADVAAPGRHAAAPALQAASRAPTPHYVRPPGYPAVRVDVTVLVPDQVGASGVERVMEGAHDPMLERVELLSEYRGAGVPSGHRSLTWRLTFRHPERTLREKEVEGRRDKLLRALETELGVRQRTS